MPSEISAAKAFFEQSSINCPPERIDIYQLGAVLCRMLSGLPVSAYLQSARASAKVPLEYRTLIDRALGYDSANCLETLVALSAEFAAAKQRCPN